MLQVRLLGQFDVQYNSEPAPIPSRPAQSLLAYLMLNAGKAQRRERLAGLLWPDSSESNARANLRQALWRLRKAIGSDTILTDKVSVTFDAHAPYWLDAAVLQNPSLESPSADELIQLLSVYAGELLPGFYDEWVVWERERLCAVYEDRMQSLLDRLTEEGRWQELHEWAERWIAGGQVPEPAYRALMLAHAELGDQAGMAAVYHRCAQALEQELGVGPAQETVQLFQRLSEGVQTICTGVDTGKSEQKTNLPSPPTPFVGREALLAEIGARLEEPACRLLTLVGPGGSGKTRLALEAASRLKRDAYEHGVYFVPLAPLEEAEEIVPTVAQAVAFTFYDEPGGSAAVEPRRHLLEYLRSKNMLLVMDNYEHLLAPSVSAPSSLRNTGRPAPRKQEVRDGAELVTEILQAARGVKILATSRANLNVQGEHLFPIAGMELPDSDSLGQAADYSVVKLFLETARRAQPHFEAKAEDLKDVVRICSLVDGMPLGILLAAGWVRILNLVEIAGEIEKSLDFLETDVRGVPERQRSVRAVFDHSWSLLSAREGEVMAALAVFRGGFTRRAAQAVTGTTLRELKGLVDKSLLAHTSTGRYQVHDLLRQYAAERLRGAENLERSPAALEATRDRHTAHYVNLLVRRAEELKGPGQQTALEEIEADSENARAAWDWSVAQGQVERLDQGMEGLCLFYERTGRYEQGDRACRRAAEALTVIGSDAGMRSEDKAPLGHRARVHARALTWRSVYHAHLGYNVTARQLVAQSLTLLDAPALGDVDIRREKAFGLRQEGSVTMWLGEYERARGLFEQSLALYRELDDRWSMAVALVGLGWTAWNLGAYTEAEGWQREGLALRRVLGDQKGIAYSLFSVCQSLIAQGRSEEGGDLAQEAIAISRDTGDRVNLAWGLFGLGWAHRQGGQFGEAQSPLEESIAIWDELESRGWKALATNLLGDLQMHSGRYQDARVRLDLSLRLARESGYKHAIRLSLFNLGLVAFAEGALAEAHRCFKELFVVAEASGLQRQMDGARVGLGLGLVERGQGNLRQAREHFGDGLRIAVEFGNDWWFHDWVPAIALLLADEGETERAVELYALASRYPNVANSRLWNDLVGKQIEACAATLPSDVVAAAQERGRARDLDATVQELLADLEE